MGNGAQDHQTLHFLYQIKIPPNCFIFIFQNMIRRNIYNEYEQELFILLHFFQAGFKCLKNLENMPNIILCFFQY